LNNKSTALFPFYDYEFMDCMASLPFNCLKNQEAYHNSLYKYVLTDKLESLRTIPIEANRRMYFNGEKFYIVRQKDPLFKKIYRKLFALPDGSFPFPIYQTFKNSKGKLVKNILLLFNKNSDILKHHPTFLLIKKYQRNEHFFRYGLIAIITIFRFEQMIKDKIEKR
jgi:hypothetical protein